MSKDATPAPLTKCGARNRQGQPCGNWPAKGRTRCRFHGGASTGPRTKEGLMKVGTTLRSHGFYSRLLPAAPDAQLYDDAPSDAALGPELKLMRAKLGTLVMAGAGESTVMDVVDAIRRLASVERQPAAVPQVPGAAFQLNLKVVGTAPEDEVIDITPDSDQG